MEIIVANYKSFETNLVDEIIVIVFLRVLIFVKFLLTIIVADYIHICSIAN
jgi:hypothetical protein